MKNPILVPAAVSALLLAACASAPPRSDELDQARAAVNALAAEPDAQQAAASDLQSARRSLEGAETAQQQKRPPEEVDSLAYLALRHAQAGHARVEEFEARQQVTRSEAERSKIVADARQREADDTRRQLAQTQQQLADLKAKQTDRGMVVTLGDVLFDSGQATLKPGAQLTVQRLAAYLMSNPQTRVRIEGYTDSLGSDDFNQALSQNRADAVASALTRQGVAADQIQSIGRGKGFPVASNATAEGRQQNRRVEIVFSDGDGRFVQPAAP
ncbi:MAG: OmpA family protein [Proteobacteria bacterium]|nr:OmpA family protein [Pseudomonadota bacterium]